MDDQTARIATTACAIWGAGISTLLGGVKLWETFWKDRLKLATTYSFSDQSDAAHEITVVNLSGVPVQICRWSLAWMPNSFRWFTSTIDVTPQEGAGIFTIPPKDSYALYFKEDSKFDWSYRTTRHRHLDLTLHIFGRSKPYMLKVYAGR